ncbi:MAG: cytidine deaminase [Terrimonas sp.]|nr:cytidine deaminase [Terrimonas sp.]
MKKNKIITEYEVYPSIEALSDQDAGLLRQARNETAHAYAPYSEFQVGAVALLANGSTVTGTNQENASFPVGLCAERVLLSSVVSQYPGIPVESIAISYHNKKGRSDHPVSPCGICRQTLTEFESRTKQKIRLILGGMGGEVMIFPSAEMLLPLAFNSSELK